MTSLDILDSDILDINSLRNKFSFKDQLIKCLKTNTFENKKGENSFEWLINFMVNPLSLIHYLEFLLYTAEEFLRFQGIFTSSSYVVTKTNKKLGGQNVNNNNSHNVNSRFVKLNEILYLLDKGIKLIFCYFFFL